MAALKSKPKIFWVGLFLLIIAASSSLAQNHAPVLNPIGSKEVYIGETLSFHISAADPDNDRVFYYSGGDLPVNSLLNPKTGFFSWTPDINQLGNYFFTFTASDRGIPSLSTSETVPVRVAYKLVRHEKVWGFGLKETEEIVETSSVADLYPKITKIEIDGQSHSLSRALFYTSENPKIRIEASSPYDIDKENISVQVDGKAIEISPFSNVQTFGEQKNVLSLAFEVSPANLSSGRHTLTFRAGNELGFASQSIEILAGKPALTDAPLTFPSPFNPASGGTISLQYTLSRNADIDIVIISSSAEIIKKFSFFKGEEGGKAGMNKISWDGKTEMGAPVAKGIYIGMIINREDRNPLGKFKLAVY